MPPAIVSHRARLAVRPDRTLRLALVADTHSAPHRDCLARLRDVAPDAVLHAGDIGDLAVLDALGSVAPVYAVRGNIDERAPDLPDVLTLDVVEGDALWMRVLLTHIAVHGPKLRAEVFREATRANAGVVVCGHSHVPFAGRDRGITVFNPGSVGPRRFALPIVFGTLSLSPEGARFAHVDCETGALWKPSPRAAPHV